MPISHFQQLDVWRQAMSLAKAVYRLTATFPRDERFGLSAQLQRAAVSIPPNIAEGNARQSTRDYARFVSIACGSNAELQTQLLLARELGLQRPADFDDILNLNERVGQMLLKLHQALVRKSKPESRANILPRSGPESRVPSPESRS
jgi:four helix bundle protein